jgi:predicted NBD/HSP70 family sugar kinase
VVRTVLDEAGSYLGLTIANLVNIMNPRAVVVGGNLAALAAFMLPARALSWSPTASTKCSMRRRS